MKILAVSDEECAALWEYYTPGKLKEYDLILSCGDLNSKYLSFLVTMARCPLLYVVGNHDLRYKIAPPEGCDPIDDHFVVYNGVRILGLGGCRRYNSADNQFTEAQMRRRIRKLRFQLWRNKGVDIVVTHAAPEGLGDAEDPCHQGFEAFRSLLDKYHPQYLVHGHVHVTYGQDVPREIDYNGTKIINAYERYTIEISDRPVPVKKLGQVIYKTRFRQNYLDDN
jgi:Icc-related predicted phosphoesterase